MRKKHFIFKKGRNRRHSLLNLKDKRGSSVIGIILFILALAVIVGTVAITGNLHLGNVGLNYFSVYKQDFGHVSCLAGAYELIGGPKYADDIKEVACTANVDSCDIILTSYSNGILGLSSTVPQWTICNSDGSSCSSQYSQSLKKGQTYKFSIQPGKKAVFYNGLLNEAKDYTWTMYGSVYSLVSEENGKVSVINQGSCAISDDLKHQFTSESPNPIPKGITYSQNYFLDFIQVATQTYKNNGQEVICQSRQIFSIDNLQMKDGNTIKVQGNNLGNVDCCPAEPNCGTDFKLHTTNTRACTFSSECANAGNPFGATQTTATYFTCDSGQCVSHTKDVECTSDAVCVQRHGANYVCDLSYANYGTCKQSTGTFCGDGYCDIGESKATCPSDCNLECAKGEKAVTITSNVNCKFLFWFCDQSVNTECQTPGLNWFKIIAIVLVVGVLIFLFIKFVLKK